MASLKLSLDAPSKLTGTGSAVVADGEDTAMIRASLLDEAGEVVAEAVCLNRFATTYLDYYSTHGCTFCEHLVPFNSVDG
eukprot:SAG31_NODE_6466_length_2006_cov_2.304143_2_plen_80_part_00